LEGTLTIASRASNHIGVQTAQTRAAGAHLGRAGSESAVQAHSQGDKREITTGNAIRVVIRSIGVEEKSEQGHGESDVYPWFDAIVRAGWDGGRVFLLRRPLDTPAIIAAAAMALLLNAGA
jgi:hypothetical protein